jgi:hypothetical protein
MHYPAWAAASVACLGLLALRAVAHDESPDSPAASHPHHATDSVALKYAEASLKLAQIDLQRAEDANERVAGTITPGAMDQLQHRVFEAQARLSALRGESGAAAASLKVLEAAATIAATRLSQAEAANRRAPGAVPQLQLERLRVGNELAQLRIERTKSLQQAPLEQQLAWEVEQLHQELDELRAQVLLLRQRN